MPIRAAYVATSNAGKLAEMTPLLRDLAGTAVTVSGVKPPLDEETGTTYLENALLKARVTADLLVARGERSFWVLADDSGLEVDALDGRPGLHTAYYAGDHAAPGVAMAKLLDELKDVTDIARRTARYRCALALVACDDEGDRAEFGGEGACEGLIAFTPTGRAGFGFDPVFIVPELQKTFGDLPDAEKHARSHRQAAFVDLKRNCHAAR